MPEKKESNSGIWTLIIIVAIFLILGLWAYYNAHRPINIITNPTQLAGVQMGTVPWIPEISRLKQRLESTGLSALSTEGTALHTHQHLDLYINGNAVPIPKDIGVNQAAGYISPIHTHDGTGIIHVESNTVRDYTLGEVFDVWGVTFTKSNIGGYAVQGDNQLNVYVNGTLVTTDPRAILIEKHQEIVITYGTTQQALKTIPSTYSFPAGL
jgi:hypothetical protein